jgi:hypothetical protein
MIVLVFMLAVMYMYIYQIGPNPIPLSMTVVLEIIFGILMLLFYRLKTTISDELILLEYGISIIKIKIKLEDIASTKMVRNRWYYGIGIRIIPGGMLYNAHGLDAVELALKHKRKKIRIGTQEPVILKREIDTRLK